MRIIVCSPTVSLVSRKSRLPLIEYLNFKHSTYCTLCYSEVNVKLYRYLILYIQSLHAWSDTKCADYWLHCECLFDETQMRKIVYLFSYCTVAYPYMLILLEIPKNYVLDTLHVCIFHTSFCFVSIHSNFRMEDKGQVISIKFSHDLKIVAVQRSQRSVVSGPAIV